MNKPTFITVGLIIILGFAVYANSLNNPFIWDDTSLVQNNAYIKSYKLFPKMFTENIAAGSGKTMQAYRPVQLVSYAIDYFFWKLKVQGYHLTNILLHILAAVAIYYLIQLLFKDRLLSGLTSILFVLHPIHTEAVTYISGRADSLALLLMLLGFIFYLKYLQLDKLSFYLLIIMSYALSLLARETSLILPALILFYHFSFHKKLKLKPLLPMLVLTLLYAILRLTALKHLLPHTLSQTNIFQRLPGVFVAVTNYLRLLVLPLGLHMEYGLKLFPWANPQAILGLIILGLLLFLARKTKRIVLFALGWFFIALLPSANLYPISAYMAEHWLYLPSIGFFLLLAYGLTRLFKTQKQLTIILTLLLVCCYSILTIQQNNLWGQPIAFYQKLLEYNPKSTRVYNNLGNAYYEIGEQQKALSLYKQSLEVSPYNAEAYYNLANIYTDIGQLSSAIALYHKAIELDPTNAQAYYNLGNTFFDLGRIPQAIYAYEQALTFNPHYFEACNNLANIYSNLGRREQAILLYQKALTINPRSAEVQFNLQDERDLYLRSK